MFKGRIKKVQEYLIKNNIDAYVCFISDDHGSEYITSTYKTIAFLSAFTGSAGTLLILKDVAYLWTDGRYFLQASMQLESSGCKLKKIGEDETIIDFIKDNVNSLAFDFKVASTSFVSALLNVKKELKLVHEEKLINDIWTNRPKLSKKKIYYLPENVVYKSANKKCQKTLSHIHYKKDYSVLVSALDDIAYLLNARGNDIPYNPVFMSFMLLNRIKGKDSYTLYICSSKLDENTKQYLRENNIYVRPYNKIYSDVSKLNHRVYIDANKTNYMLNTLI